MNEREFLDWLHDAIVRSAGDDDMELRVRTYEDAGMLTYNKGLVVRCDDGAEFQLTLVQSRAGDEEEN